jgi:hypothetical protein
VLYARIACSGLKPTSWPTVERALGKAGERASQVGLARTMIGAHVPLFESGEDGSTMGGQCW